MRTGEHGINQFAVNMPARRKATEVDVRVTFHVDEADVQATAEAFVTYVREAIEAQLVYGMFGNVELGASTWKSVPDPKFHIHGALVFAEPVKLWTMKAAFKQFPGMVDVYVVPRNTKFPYKSWIMHHNKLETKVGSNVPLWTTGKLPSDDGTADTLRQIIRMGRKFGFDVSHEQAMLAGAVQPKKPMDKVGREQARLTKQLDSWVDIKQRTVLERIALQKRFHQISRTKWNSTIMEWETTNGRHPARVDV